MVFVSKKKGESKDRLFRKFTRTFIEENIVDDVRSKLFYKNKLAGSREIVRLQSVIIHPARQIFGSEGDLVVASQAVTVHQQRHLLAERIIDGELCERVTRPG